MSLQKILRKLMSLAKIWKFFHKLYYLFTLLPAAPSDVWYIEISRCLFCLRHWLHGISKVMYSCTCQKSDLTTIIYSCHMYIKAYIGKRKQQTLWFFFSSSSSLHFIFFSFSYTLNNSIQYDVLVAESV